MLTQGWDTVSAASVDAVNHVLQADPRMVLTSFSFSLPAPADYRGDGQFGPWRIVPGGSGQLLHIELPITSGTLTKGTGAAVPIAGLSAVVEVALELLPSRTQTGDRDLRFTMNSVGDQPGRTGPGVVTPIRLDDPAKKLGFEAGAVLLAAIAAALAQHGGSVAWIFATVGPVTGTDSWLSPSASGFCYYESAAGGYLAVFNLTGGTDIAALPRKVEPALVAGGPAAAFAFSRELFLRHVIAPKLPDSFGHGTNAATFRFEPSDSSIVNTGRIPTDSVKSGAIWYDPYIDGLKITVEGSTLVTSVHGSCDMGLGITMTFAVQSRNETSVDTATGTMTFRRDANPTTHHEASIPWYDWFLGPIPDLVMAIVVPIVADSIADGLNAHASAAPIENIGDLSIHWTGFEKFHATAAGLNDSFYLKGDVATT
ncbi:MAG TPA: TULIP family P47-like protein [Mycobacteriales bacterium]|nr:TULIP family P47-like protein [Mycobacteriales bacterium]